ncbi:MAG: hypothetical protein QOJ73_5033 [Streptosporangiaceae bacterium]|jgi:hypothetical protein|nr:hypothetical protein [Streptosporangiaceae bacterium]
MARDGPNIYRCQQFYVPSMTPLTNEARLSVGVRIIVRHPSVPHLLMVVPSGNVALQRYLEEVQAPDRLVADPAQEAAIEFSGRALVILQRVSTAGTLHPRVLA